MVSMKKVKSFCISNKPLVVIALVSILIGTIFNEKLISFTNINSQSAQVISAGPTTPPSYNQYPALSNSGFYLETSVNSGGYYQALVGTKATMTDISKDIKSLIADYYSSSCVSIASDSCAGKRTTILNSLYTYASYVTAYNKILYESTHGVITNYNIDWAGISSASVYTSLLKPFIKRTPTVDTIDNLLADISSNIKNTFDKSIVSGSYTYTSPLASDTIQSLASFLKTKQNTLSMDNVVPHVSLFNKEQNLASVGSVLGGSLASVNTFTINGSTALTVDQGSTLTIVWNIVNGSSCYAMGGVGTSWTKNSSGVTSSMLPIPASGVVNTTMGSSVNQIFTLLCGVSSGSSLTNLTKSITVGVNPAKAVQAIQAMPAQSAPLQTALVQTASTQVSPVQLTVTPINTSSGSGSGPGSGKVTLPGSSNAGSAFVGPINTASPTIYNNPYLFVFGANALGNLDFKILNKASAGNISSKFGQVNGSVGEVDVTKANLAEIGNRIPANKLTAANFSATVDSKILQPITCDPNVGDYSSIAGAATGGADCVSIKMIEIAQPEQAYVLGRKIKFYDSDFNLDFAFAVSNSVGGGNSLDVFFSKILDNKSIGSVDGSFVQSDIIQNTQNGSVAASITKTAPKSTESSADGATPLLDSQTDGICGIIATVRSLNETLNLPLPKGYPKATTTIISGGQSIPAYSKNYLEKLLSSSGGSKIITPKYDSNGKITSYGIRVDNYIKMYQAYVGSSMSATDQIFEPPIVLKDQIAIKKLMDGGKTDCALGTNAHISHIDNVSFQDPNLFVVGIADGLDQNDSIVKGKPVVGPPPEFGFATTFKFNPFGKLVKILDSSYHLDYWNTRSNLSGFYIHCVTVNSR